MLNAYVSGLLALALSLPASAQAADAVEDRQRAALSGHYTLQGAGDAASELLLKPDGHFEFTLSYALAVETARGRWDVAGDSVVLRTQSAGATPVFSLDRSLPWNPDAQKRLLEFAQERRETTIEQACGFVKTYRDGLASGELAAIADLTGPIDPARRREAEASLGPALAALEQSRLALETAAAAAIEARVRHPEPCWPPLASAADAAAAAAEAAMAAANGAQPPPDEAPANEMEAAERAAQTYLQRLRQVWRLHATAERPTPDLRAAKFGAERCAPVSAVGEGGYAVVVGDPKSGARAQGIGVEFAYSDGRSEHTETGPSGWALAVPREGARLKHVVLRPADLPPQTLALDEDQGRIFAITLDSAAARPVPFDWIILGQDDGALIMPNVRGRYVRD
ncbi:MAG: hypothetical protein HOQ32_13270 [Lysobacter sp.]|nr:hypothetical protein [Lysobacter sp.]